MDPSKKKDNYHQKKISLHMQPFYFLKLSKQSNSPNCKEKMKFLLDIKLEHCKGAYQFASLKNLLFN